MIVTGEIKMSGKKMLSLLFMQYGIPWLILTLAGILIFVILGIVIDYRFFILALIWIFLFIPLVMAFLYFYYGMLPLTNFNTIPHKILFSDSEIRIRVLPVYNEKQSTASKEELEHKDNEEASLHKENGNQENIMEDAAKDYVVEKDLFKEMKSGGDYVLLHFKKNGWLWLPVYAFDSFQQFKNVLEFFNNFGKKAI